MSDSIPPLDDDLRALLSAERLRPPVAPVVRSRMLGRIEGSIAAGAGVAGVAVAGLAKGGTKTWIVLLAFAVGGLAGAGVTYFARGPSERVVEKRIEVPTVVTVTVMVPASVPVVPPTPTPVASATTALAQPTPPIAPSGSGSASAADERNLIDAMRTALKAGDSSGALGFVSAHEKRFPSGAFTEEREAYAVQALARAGRAEDARTRADRFRKRYPASLLLPIVDQASPVNP